MRRIDQIKEWVKKYELGYYFNPGGVEFFCPAFPDIKSCQVSEYIDCDDVIYKDDEGFQRLFMWIEQNKDNFLRPKPKQYTYYSEGIIKHVL